MAVWSDLALKIAHRAAVVPFKAVGPATGRRVSLEARLIEYSFAHANLDGRHQPRRVLDVGCSGTRFPIELAKRGHEVYGIDVGGYPDQRLFSFVRGDATKMPFDDRFFDVVTAISSVEHIGLGRYGDATASEGDKEAMREIARVLKPVGHLLMTVPCGKDTICYSKDGVPLARVYSSSSLLELMRGFEVLEMSYIVKNRCVWLPASMNETEKAVERARPERSAMTAIALIVGCKEAA
jgi:SAM-dependent methyltransferase